MKRLLFMLPSALLLSSTFALAIPKTRPDYSCFVQSTNSSVQLAHKGFSAADLTQKQLVFSKDGLNFYAQKANPQSSLQVEITDGMADVVAWSDSNEYAQLIDAGNNLQF